MRVYYNEFDRFAADWLENLGNGGQIPEGTVDRRSIKTVRPATDGGGVMGVQEVLKERGKRYGDFKGHADITQSIKCVMRHHPNWEHLKKHHWEALDMIAHKIGRIVNGDPDYADSWVDIAGYAQLIVNDLPKGQGVEG